MNREEVLEKSRAELRNQDDYEQEILKQASPTAKLALVLCIALDKKFEDLFYF